MSVETATYISDLNSANPPSSDVVADGATHLRLLKAVLKATFPNITGAVTSTQKDLNRPIPIGLVALWGSTQATIPAGWALCSGQTVAKSDGSGNITLPDLRDRFVVGAGLGYTAITTGGAIIQTGTTSSVSAGTPSGSLSFDGAHSHFGATGFHVLTIAEMPVHSHTTNASFQVNVASGGTGVTAFAGATQTGTTGGGSSHNHTIPSDGSHNHTYTGVALATHAHTVSISDGRPPWYALCYIMRV